MIRIKTLKWMVFATAVATLAAPMLVGPSDGFFFIASGYYGATVLLACGLFLPANGSVVFIPVTLAFFFSLGLPYFPTSLEPAWLRRCAIAGVFVALFSTPILLLANFGAVKWGFWPWSIAVTVASLILGYEWFGYELNRGRTHEQNTVPVD